ncbi:MAG TPA: acyltransferase [Phycisphaerae bacterium]|nr:acyltransferase [Phycisphaerae bacterium]
MFVHVGSDVKVHHTVRTYGRNWLGDKCMIMDNVILGFPTTQLLLGLRQVDLNLEHAEYDGCTLGENGIIRSGSVVYANVRIGNDVRTGHNVLIRENTTIGHNVMIGTNTVLDNNCQIGNHVSMQSGVYLPTGTVIGDYVFLGPGATFTNDRFPVRTESPLTPAVVERGVSVGANCVVLPGITIGQGALLGAGSVVTKDVPEWHMAVGSPARCTPLPEHLKVQNRII